MLVLLIFHERERPCTQDDRLCSPSPLGDQTSLLFSTDSNRCQSMCIDVLPFFTTRVESLLGCKAAFEPAINPKVVLSQAMSRVCLWAYPMRLHWSHAMAALCNIAVYLDPGSAPGLGFCCVAMPPLRCGVRFCCVIMPVRYSVCLRGPSSSATRLN